MWLVRAEMHGEREELALENDIAVIGWDELPDVTGIADRSKLTSLIEETYPEAVSVQSASPCWSDRSVDHGRGVGQRCLLCVVDSSVARSPKEQRRYRCWSAEAKWAICPGTCAPAVSVAQVA